MSSSTKKLPIGQLVSVFLSVSALLIVVTFSIIPAPAHASCVQLQTFPPRTVCTDDSGVVTSGSGVVSTDNSAGGSVTGGSLPISTEGSPVAFWKFDESSGVTAFDSSGNGNNGVLENGATRYVGVVQGNKLLLDGVDDRMRVETTSANILNMNAFTVMAWIRPTEYGGVIVRKGNTDVARFNFGLRSDGVLYLRAGYSERSASWQTTNPLPLNTWSHVAVTYTYGTANKPTIYLNGVAQPLRSSVSNPGTYDPADPVGTPVADTPYIYIGNNHDFANRSQVPFDGAFEGRMDIVRVYNSALSAAAILSAKTPEPEASAYTPLPPVQQPDGTWIQPLSAANSSPGNDSLIAGLQVQIQALLAQIAALQGSVGAATQGNGVAQAYAGTCPAINRTLARGSRGDDVRQLQAFLIARNMLATGNDTGYFGPLTETAVQAWQQQSGVVSSGSPETNGYGVFGPRTRAAFMAACQ